MARAEMRRSITANQAEACLGIPAATIRGWAKQKRLLPCGIGERGEREYRLVDVLDLRATTQRRARHTRPNRCCQRPAADIT